MASLLDGLSKLLRPAPRPGPEELKARFRASYASFRALLTANNDALERMAEMEASLHRGEPFGMAFVRGQCTALGVDVYRMVQALRELSDGRHGDLPDRFGAITARIEAILAGQPEVTQARASSSRWTRSIGEPWTRSARSSIYESYFGAGKSIYGDAA